MSAYEGSKMQERDEDRKQGFLGHIKEAKQGKNEVDKERQLVNLGIENLWYKAQVLTIEEFKGWLKGEGYSLSKKSI